MIPPTNLLSLHPSSFPHFWRLRGIAVLLALLLHGVLLFFFPPFFDNTRVHQQPITIEFLDFPAPSSPPLTENSLPPPENKTVVSPTETIVETEPPEEKTAVPLETVTVETEPPPLIQKIESEPPEEKMRIEPPPEEINVLNELIQEKESEQMSMVLEKEKQARQTKNPVESQEKIREEEKEDISKNETMLDTQQVESVAEKSENASSSQLEKISSSTKETTPAPAQHVEEESLAYLPVDPTFQLPTISSDEESSVPDTIKTEVEPLPEKYFLRSDTPTTASNKETSLEQNMAPLPQEKFLSGLPLNSSKADKASYPVPNTSVGRPGTDGVFYGLDNYNWPYESYMGRWAKGLLYSWRNNPPVDYVAGNVPQGGNIFVLVTLNLKGELIAYEVTDVEKASSVMVDSVLNAILATANLPPLPPDFEGEELKVHFKFIYPSLYHLLRKR